MENAILSLITVVLFAMMFIGLRRRYWLLALACGCWLAGVLVTRLSPGSAWWPTLLLAVGLLLVTADRLIDRKKHRV